VSRVALCVQNLPVPDDRRVWREACALRDAGHVVSIVAPCGSGQPRHEVLDGITIRRWTPSRERRGVLGQVSEALAGFARTARELRELERAAGLDVVHVANPPDGYAVLARALHREWKVVYDQHDLCPELFDAQRGARTTTARVLRPILRRIERWSYRSADLVILPNNSYRAVALDRGGVSPAAAIVVRNGPDRVDPACTPPELEGKTLDVVFAGMMNRQDRVDVLLHAAAAVAARRPGTIELTLVGTGDDVPRLRGLADDLGITDLVRWTGWLDADGLLAELHRATVGVSLDDNTPFSRLSTMTKIAEYLAVGLPCIAADLPENRFTADDAARYFTPADSQDLAAAFLSLLDDPLAIGSMRAAALSRAPSLVWDRSAQRLVAAYKWLLDRGPAVVGDQHIDVAVEVAA